MADKVCAIRGAKCARKLLVKAGTTRNVRRLLARLVEGTAAEIYLTLYYKTDSDLGNAVREVNRALRAAARPLADDVIVVRPPSFAGHSCFAPKRDRWMLGWTDLCLHPNPTGVRRFADAVFSAYQVRHR